MRYRFEKLETYHDVSGFNSRNTGLDILLRDEAFIDQQKDLSRTFVLLDTLAPTDKSVIGFFTLRAEAQYITDVDDFNKSVYLPVVEIIGLARDRNYSGQGLGDVLLIEALTYVARASELIGVAGVYLCATEEGKKLYTKADYGFRFLTDDDTERRMFLPMNEVRLIVSVQVEE